MVRLRLLASVPFTIPEGCVPVEPLSVGQISPIVPRLLAKVGRFKQPEVRLHTQFARDFKWWYNASEASIHDQGEHS